MKKIETQIQDYLKKTQYYKTKKRIKNEKYLKRRGPVDLTEPFL